MHCLDNDSDRKLGERWERQFCLLAAGMGKVFTPMQIGRDKSAQAWTKNKDDSWSHWTLPDITVWTSPGEHHEIKHKAPTNNGRFGLEVYRFNALLIFMNITNQQVLYTIHNHALNGGRDNTDSHIEHWFTASISDLDNKWNYIQQNGVSWINGTKKANIPIYYWNISFWKPLKDYWITVAETIDEVYF